MPNKSLMLEGAALRAIKHAAHLLDSQPVPQHKRWVWWEGEWHYIP